MAILVVLAQLDGMWLSRRPVAAAGYQMEVTTGGSLEARYLATGLHTVTGRTVGQFQSFSPYRLWFLTDLPSSATLPVVLVANGTGVKAEKYAAWFERLASWGFLVVGTDDEYSWSGLSQAASIRLLQSIQAGTTASGWADNPLKGRIDLTRVGLAGHSQGGVGVFSTLADKNVTGVTFKAAYAASPTNLHLAHNLGWDYTAEHVTVPTLFLSSTGLGDHRQHGGGLGLVALERVDHHREARRVRQLHGPSQSPAVVAGGRLVPGPAARLCAHAASKGRPSALALPGCAVYVTTDSSGSCGRSKSVNSRSSGPTTGW